MYKVKFGGKKGKTMNLVESPDMVVIRTKNNQKIDQVQVSRESRELLDSSQEVASFPEAGVTVRKVATEDAGDLVARRDETRAALKQEENIRFAGRVLQDANSGEVMLYTENFFVKFKDDVSEADCLAILEKYKLSIKSKLVFAVNSWFVEAEEGTGLNVFNIAEEILKEKQVEFCHPELVQERRYKGIHPLQWHLAATSIGGKTVDAHVNIEKAWAITKGEGITIAVIDDGIEIDHPEFAGRVVSPYDATQNNHNPRPKEDDDKHGTPCAGMACAAGLKDGASGTAPESFLMPIRLRSGLGSMAEANAFAWAADHGADVISCSWGPSDGNWWDPSDPMHNSVTPLPDSTRLAIDYAMNKGRKGKGCVVLFAAGNGNEDTKNDGYASNPQVIAVGACNDSGKRSVYSDYGDAVWVCFPSGDFAWKPFAHPGPASQGLRTTDRLNSAGYDAKADYTNTFGGTSGACPGMAGVVALMLSVNRNLTPAEIKDIIRRSCTRIDEKDGEYDAQGHSIWYGYGRIDAFRAVENARPAASDQTELPLEGSVRFSTKGLVTLPAKGAFTEAYSPALKVLGVSLALKPADKDLKLRYKVNISGKGIVENKNEGEFVGTTDGRKRILGFAVSLEGPKAGQYEVRYAARLRGVATPQTAQNGAFCGTDKKTGKTIEGISVSLRKK